MKRTGLLKPTHWRYYSNFLVLVGARAASLPFRYSVDIVMGQKIHLGSIIQWSRWCGRARVESQILFHPLFICIITYNKQFITIWQINYLKENFSKISLSGIFFFCRRERSCLYLRMIYFYFPRLLWLSIPHRVIALWCTSLGPLVFQIYNS